MKNHKNQSKFKDKFQDMINKVQLKIKISQDWNNMKDKSFMITNLIKKMQVNDNKT